MGSVISQGVNYTGSGIGNPISIDGAGMYASGPNFVVCCSPSQNTCNNDDDCQYTNSSAARSHVAMSIEQVSSTGRATEWNQFTGDDDES